MQAALPSNAEHNKQAEPCLRSVEELNERTHWFIDPMRSSTEEMGDRNGRCVVVEDNFYDPDDLVHPTHPEELRALALRQNFYQYSPARSVDFDAATYAKIRAIFPKPAKDDRPVGKWEATALKVFAGHEVKNPAKGFRYNPEWLRVRLSKLLGETVDPKTWKWGGEWWNGAFHLIDENYAGSSIHHHWRTRDVGSRGWSGLVYLSPDAPPSSGTSIVLDERTERCVGPHYKAFGYDWSHCRRALRVENRFNRLVLFRDSVLHVAERGFGLGKAARLTQTFFFHTTRE